MTNVVSHTGSMSITATSRRRSVATSSSIRALNSSNLSSRATGVSFPDRRRPANQPVTEPAGETTRRLRGGRERLRTFVTLAGALFDQGHGAVCFANALAILQGLFAPTWYVRRRAWPQEIEVCPGHPCRDAPRSAPCAGGG